MGDLFGSGERTLTPIRWVKTTNPNIRRPRNNLVPEGGFGPLILGFKAPCPTIRRLWSDTSNASKIVRLKTGATEGTRTPVVVCLLTRQVQSPLCHGSMEPKVGIEPTTSSLPRMRSATELRRLKMELPGRLELPTPCLPSRCATNCATAA